VPIRTTAPAQVGTALALLLEVTAALAVASPALSQTPPPARAAAPVPPGTESPEAIVKALYAVISGPAGQKRDWDRFRALCMPDARLIATHVMPDGTTRLRSLSVDEYAQSAAHAFDTQGFYETGTVRDLARYDRTVTIVSPYESRHAPGEAPFARGVNHFQLYNDGHRWWVVDIFWEDQPPGGPSPLAGKIRPLKDD
jgi:hypothetical protein